jgi:hypothetical protein
VAVDAGWVPVDIAGGVAVAVRPVGATTAEPRPAAKEGVGSIGVMAGTTGPPAVLWLVPDAALLGIAGVGALGVGFPAEPQDAADSSMAAPNTAAMAGPMPCGGRNAPSCGTDGSSLPR